MSKSMRSEAARLYEGRIKHHVEESVCEWCGTPLYVGDRIYWSTAGLDYCSVVCGENDAFDAGYGNGGVS